MVAILEKYNGRPLHFQGKMGLMFKQIILHGIHLPQEGSLKIFALRVQVHLPVSLVYS